MIADEQPPTWLFGATWFKMLNMFLFSSTHGFLTTAIILQVLLKVPLKSKERTGYTISTVKIFGILCGNLIALSYKEIGSVPNS